MATSMLWTSCFPRVGYIKLGTFGKEGRRERNQININLKSLFYFGPSGQQLSTFLIEHSYAAEKNKQAPSQQDISKFKADDFVHEVSIKFGLSFSFYSIVFNLFILITKLSNKIHCGVAL